MQAETEVCLTETARDIRLILDDLQAKFRSARHDIGHGRPTRNFLEFTSDDGLWYVSIDYSCSGEWITRHFGPETPSEVYIVEAAGNIDSIEGYYCGKNDEDPRELTGDEREAIYGIIDYELENNLLKYRHN